MNCRFFPLITVLLLIAGCEKNDCPRACFTFTRDRALTNTTVTPDNCSENCVEYLWDDGDGHQFTAFEPPLTCQEAGKYWVTLTAYSENREKQSNVTDTIVVNIPTGKVTFWQDGRVEYYPQVKVTIGNQTETITNYYPKGVATCDLRGCANFTLPPGTYYFHARSVSTEWDNTVDIEQGKCFKCGLISYTTFQV